MGFLKKLGRQLKIGHGKKLGKKLTGDIGKIGKKGGRAVEQVGNVSVLTGAATGFTPLVGVGGAMIAGGKLAQDGGNVLRATSKGKLEKAVKGMSSMAQS
jgi:hypothetical protein